MQAWSRAARMRLYLDFDGYFAAVEEQVSPALHGRPVAVIPYPEARTACSREPSTKPLYSKNKTRSVHPYPTSVPHKKNSIE